MCSHYRAVENPTEKVGYILYNLVFSGDNDEFTVEDVCDWLKPYGIEMTPADVRWQLSSYVESGILHSYYDHYTVPRSRRRYRNWYTQSA